MAVGNVNRALEQLCDELDAKKTLYSSIFYSEDDFFARYNGEALSGPNQKRSAMRDAIQIAHHQIASDVFLCKRCQKSLL